MWIRIQNKKQLVEASDLYIAKRGKGYSISTGKGTDFGTYSTIEKAVKVMDMIQEKILSPHYQNDIGANKIAIYKEKIFEMPQDSEVE